MKIMTLKELMDVLEAQKLLEQYPISEEEQKPFLESEKRVRRVIAADRFKDFRIVVRIDRSDACIAGHVADERLYFDSMGRLLVAESEKPVCIRLLNRIWYRLIMVLDRMADEESLGDGRFTGEIPGIRMSCYGADFPSGDCGQVLMEISVEKMKSL